MSHVFARKLKRNIESWNGYLFVAESILSLPAHDACDTEGKIGQGGPVSQRADGAAIGNLECVRYRNNWWGTGPTRLAAPVATIFARHCSRFLPGQRRQGSLNRRSKALGGKRRRDHPILACHTFCLARLLRLGLPNMETRFLPTKNLRQENAGVLREST